MCYEIAIKIKRCVNHLWLHATPQSCLYYASFCSILLYCISSNDSILQNYTSHGFCLISNQFHRKHCMVNDIESVLLYDIIFACIESYQIIYNVSCWKVILTCILYNSISYIYMSLRKWIWIKTCLQDSRSPPELLFRFFDGSSSCKWTFLPVRWKIVAPQNQKLTPLTKRPFQKGKDRVPGFHHFRVFCS